MEEIKKKTGVLMVVDPQLHEMADAIETVEKLLAEDVMYVQPVDFVLIIDNGNLPPFSDFLSPRLQNDRRLAIVRLDQRSTVGNCMSHAVNLFKMQPPPHLLVINPGTQLTGAVIEAATYHLEEYPDEISAVYGDIYIDGQWVICSGFDRSFLTSRGHLSGPTFINLDAVFKMIEETKLPPFDIELNSFPLIIFDLLIRMTDFSMAIHIPETIATLKSEKISADEVQKSHQYLTKKYAGPQVPA